MELKFGTGVNSEALISNSSQKKNPILVRFEGEKCDFLRKTEIFAKRSLTKVLPWQHPRLLLTENYFK